MSTVVYSVNLVAQLLISVFLFSQIAAPRKNFIKILTLWYIPYEIVHIYFNFFNTLNIPDGIQTIFNCIIIFFVLLFLYDGKIIKKIGIVISYVLFQAVTEIISIAVVCVVFKLHMSDFYEYGDKNIYVSSARVMYADILMLLVIAVSFIIKRRSAVSEKKESDFGIMSGFTVMHLVFLCLFYRFNTENLSEENNLIQMIFQTMLFIMIFIQYSNFLKIRKYAETEKEYAVLKNEMDSTYSYYSLAQNKFNEISEIRHDISNQIQTARKLMSSPESKTEAENILDDLHDNLQALKNVNFCSNHTVNAVLTVKINDEKYRSISTDILLKDIEKLPFTDYEICSLVSNLYDNAADECLKVPEPSERFIYIRCECIGNFCVLKFTNSASGEKIKRKSEKTGAGHGYGIKIIEKLCQKYGGEFILSQENSQVCASVTVMQKNN